MELRVLKYFLEAARDGNITKAAARLHITQPTLTRQLHQLEDELGVKLFNRGSFNIRLTTEGILLK
ncbi:MAG: LysR family transcriptional regulator [Synergistaceae bacterium]|nr:LysR family transcriptional regulator [Synergistaceae bacterium]